MMLMCTLLVVCVFFLQAEDGIRDLVRSRGLGDVYKRQDHDRALAFRDVVVDRADVDRLRAIPSRRARAALRLSLIHI